MDFFPFRRTLPTFVGLHRIVPVSKEGLRQRAAASASECRVSSFVSVWRIPLTRRYACARGSFTLSWASRQAIIAVSELNAGSETAALPERVFQTFVWRGRTINYRASGPPSGQQVLLVHGFGASIRHWRKNWPALEDAGCCVYALDLLGFGASDKPDVGIGGYSLELWRDLCVDFICKFGRSDGQFVLIGNSIGGLVSLMTAVALPERIAGLCLIACPGGMVPFRRSELSSIAACLLWLVNTALFNRFTGPLLFRTFRTRKTVSAAVTQAYAGAADAIDDELLDILCEPAFDDGAEKVFLAILNGPSGPTPEELLVQTRWCPTLVLWGSDDPFTPLSGGMHPGIRFSEYNANIKLDVLTNGGHCPHDARPSWVNDRIVKFALDPAVVAPVRSK